MDAFIGAWYGVDLSASRQDRRGGVWWLAEIHPFFGVDVVPGGERAAGPLLGIFSDAHGMWELAVDPGDPGQTVRRLADPDWEPVALPGPLSAVVLRLLVGEAVSGAPYVAEGLADDVGCFAGLHPITRSLVDGEPLAYTDGTALIRVHLKTDGLVVAHVAGATIAATRTPAEGRLSLEGWFYDLPT